QPSQRIPTQTGEDYSQNRRADADNGRVLEPDEEGLFEEEPAELLSGPRVGPENAFARPNLQIALEGCNQDPVEGEEDKDEHERQANGAANTAHGPTPSFARPP